MDQDLVEQYRLNAKKARGIADAASDAEERNAWLEIAREWEALVEARSNVPSPIRSRPPATSS